MIFRDFMGYNWLNRPLVAFIKTGAAVANHVFAFCQ